MATSVLIDGAQTVAQPRQRPGARRDFFAFSGHKIFGPTGIGVLYGSRKCSTLPPWQGGGNMITDVTLEEDGLQHPPGRFEAGTPSIGDAAGLATALDYVARIGMPNIAKYEHELLEYGTEKLCEIPGLRLVGTARRRPECCRSSCGNKRGSGRRRSTWRGSRCAGHHCSQPSCAGSDWSRPFVPRCRSTIRMRRSTASPTRFAESSDCDLSLTGEAMTQATIATISPAEFQELRKAGKTPELIDVRTPVEFQGVHAEGAHALSILDPSQIFQGRQSAEPVYVI